MFFSKLKDLCVNKTGVLFLIVLASSYVTYFHNYDYPPYLYWDESYHISSAQKYLHGVHFMEPHPPLGKLLIALGEYLVGDNTATDQFLDTVHVKVPALPEGFSFKGYRLIPVLLAWLTAPLFFLCFLLLTRNGLTAFLLSGLYVFDNALIVHNRAAMLDGPHLFFIVASVLLYLCVLRWRDRPRSFVLSALLMGVLFACIVGIKVNGLIMILLFPALALGLWPEWRKTLKFFGLFVVGFIPIYIGIWWIHFSIAREINPKLERGGYFRASDEYKEILDDDEPVSLSNFPLMWKDSYKFFKRYEAGVPKLNICRTRENGSPAFMWPIGARSISYRWERDGTEGYRYLYLQSNPAVWFSALAGVILAISILIASLLFPAQVMVRQRSTLFFLLSIYLAYMLVMLRIERAMYLYHYFIPLIIAFLILSIVINEIKQIGSLKLTNRRKNIGLSILLFLIIGFFVYYSPLTYYKTISNEKFLSKALLRAWDLTCVGCPRTNTFAVPVNIDKKKDSKVGHMRIDGVAAYQGEQEWGKPQFGKTVTGQPLVFGKKKYKKGLGVHAYSFLRFALRGEYARFKVKAGLPDYLKDKPASVVFEIRGNGKKLWKSKVVRAGAPLKKVDVSVRDVDVLELRVTDADDGNSHDHGSWVMPKLVKARPDTITIGNVPAVAMKQSWGLPRLNKNVLGKPLTIDKKTYASGIGVHSKSRLTFRLNGHFSAFKSKFGMPDYITHKTAGVIFSVLIDGQKAWSSDAVKPGKPPQEVEIPLAGASILELRVTGVNDDAFTHGMWLEPELFK